MSLADHALRYAADGLEIFPARPDTKAPYTAHGMKDATTDAPTIRRWWTQHPDALIAARIPENVVILDIDDRHGGFDTLNALTTANGPLPDTRIHASGRGDGGCHIWLTRPPGKLVDAPGIDVLHHQWRYTILPPSPHPQTGRPYEWVTEATHPIADCPPWVALTIAAPPTPPKPPPAPIDPDSPADWYTRNHSWRDLLTRHGWELVRGDGDSDGSTWRHPTATSAWSATVTHRHLFVYSPNTPFDVTQPGHPAGYTLFRAWAALEHRGDMSEAAREAKRLRGDQPHLTDHGIEIAIRASHITGDVWETTERLAHIRQAARSAMVAPDAVLAAVLARLAAFTPPTRTVWVGIGGPVPLALYAAVLASTGGGKSTASRVAARLLPHVPPSVAGPVSLGSGEGLIELYLETVTDTGDDGKPVTRKEQKYQGALVELDEGRILSTIGGRKGATVLPVLCTAWTGGALGQANASHDTFRQLAAGTYTLGLVSAWQPAKAAELFDDTDGGLPGRFLFVSATDPDASRNRPEWPGELDWRPPPIIHTGGHITYADEIIAEVQADHYANLTGATTPEPLDAHRNLQRLKVAGLLAALHNSAEVDMPLWRAATGIVESSDNARAAVLEHVRRAAAEREGAATQKAVRRDAAMKEGEHRRVLESAARCVANRARRSGVDGVTRRELTLALSGDQRRVVSVDEAIDEAASRGWLSESSDRWVAGESRPA